MRIPVDNAISYILLNSYIMFMGTFWNHNRNVELTQEDT